MNLRQSLLISLLSRYAQLIVNLGSSVVIARLLSPSEMGAFSLAMVLLSFVAIFRDFGASTYLAQAKELSDQKVRAVMGLQILMGSLLAAAAAVSSYPMSAIYAEPSLTRLMPWVAFSYLISPFGTVTQALLLRDMNFSAIAKIQVGASVVSGVVSVGLAAYGFGATSLAIGQFSMVLASVAFSLPYRPRGLPWRPSLKGSREIFGFGGAVTGTAIVNVLVKGAPEMLLGKLQNIYSVGLFARGQGMVVMFGRQLTDAVASVALPNFARLEREGGNLGEAFLQGTSYVCAVAWSCCAGLAILASPLIEVLYGAQWREAVPLVRWVAGAYGTGLSVMLASSALSACGQVNAVALATLTSGAVTLLVAAIGATRGLEAVGAALFIASFGHVAIFFGVVQRRLGFAWSALGFVMLRCAVVALVTAMATLLVVAFPKPATVAMWVDLIGGALAGALGFCVALVLARHPLRRELGLALGKLRRIGSLVAPGDSN